MHLNTRIYSRFSSTKSFVDVYAVKGGRELMLQKLEY